MTRAEHVDRMQERRLEVRRNFFKRKDSEMAVSEKKTKKKKKKKRKAAINATLAPYFFLVILFCPFFIIFFYDFLVFLSLYNLSPCLRVYLLSKHVFLLLFYFILLN